MSASADILDLVQGLIEVVRVEQGMREDLQKRIAALESKQPRVSVEMPRLQAAMSAKEN